jgi:amino acid adenylation domain-containing protein
MNARLHDGVTAQAQRRPEAIAVVHRDRALTYGALETISNQLAHLLAALGCQRGDRVGLLLPKMPEAIVAILGALKADAIYVPLDPAGPAARLARMLAAADCRVVLAAGGVESLLRDALAAAALDRPPLVGVLDDALRPHPDPQPVFFLRDLAAHPAAPRAGSASGDDIAHILFTSGSTGTPKGVTIAHRNAVHFIRWATRHFGIAPADRISQQPPLHFDLSTFDIFGTLWSGAQLHLVPPELNLLPHKLAQFIRDARLTQWFSVPALLNLLAMFDAVVPHDFPALRRVLFAGEVLPTTTLIYWMRRLPHARFTNLYGPTETTISSCHHTLPHCPRDARAPIPLGTPCDGEEVLLLDEQMRPVADGEIGEIYIRGPGVSPGYWRDADRTRAAFVPAPDAAHPAERVYKTGDLAHRGADGLLYFHGRADMQIKCRGYRIELGEIEAALHALPGVRESAVVAIPSDGFEGALLCCAYAGDAIGTDQLRSRLAALVPAYMLPQRWLRLDALPKNPNGKIDRPRLKETFARIETAAPQRSAAGVAT